MLLTLLGAALLVPAAAGIAFAAWRRATGDLPRRNDDMVWW